MLLRSLLVLLACLSLAFIATPAQAQQVQLAWDAPVQANGAPVPNLAGYKLYYGSQSGQYSTMIPVGLTTTHTVINLSAGQTYYFAATAYDSTDLESPFSNEVSVTIGLIPQQQMRVVSVDSQELAGENGAVTNALDGNPATFWHTEWYQRTAPLPHTLVLDLGASYQIDGFRYVPRQDGDPNGTIAGYQFYVSPDGTTWGTAVAAGTLAANTTEKTVRFTAKTGRFVRLVALSEINGRPYTSAAELQVLGTIRTLPSVTVSAAPPSLAAGQSATLTWATTNATTCSAPWTTSTAPSGSQSVKPTVTTAYTMTCTGAGGTTSASATVTVLSKPSVTVSAAPPSLAAGQSATLTWATTNATTCSAPWTTSTAPSGSQSVKPTVTIAYTMTCTGAGGTTSASATVTVLSKPSVTVSAAPPSLAAGQSATLTWATTNATTCSAPWTTSTAPSGSQSVKPTVTTAYTMTCTGAGGTTSASATVTVLSKPSVTVSAAPPSLAAGQSATLTWATTNATTCSAPWTTSTAPSGSQSVKPTVTTAYTMTCTGAGGTTSASATVTVLSKPSVTVSAAPPSLAAGQSATLTWATTNATTCSAPWTTSTAPSGSQSVKPTVTIAYTMTCTGAGGTTSASATVAVNTPEGSLIPQQQIRVMSVDSQDMAGGNYAATNALDGNSATMWHTEWALRAPAPPHTLVLDLGARYQVDGWRYLPRQDGNPNGTIGSYEFYVSDDGTTWGTAVTAGTLAANTTEKTVRFTAKTGRFVRLVALSEINGRPYTSAAELNFFGTAIVAIPTGGIIPQQQIRVVSVDSQDMAGGNYAATNALDGNSATMWHTEWALRAPAPPHTLVLDLGARYQVDGWRYLPRQDGNSNGTIGSYEFYVSDDGTTWSTAVTAGTLAANTTEKTVRFTAKTGRFVRLVALSEINGRPYTSAAELNFFGVAVPSSTTTTSSLLTQSVMTSPVTSSSSTTTVSKSTTTTSSTSASQPTTQTASATAASATSSSSTPTMTASQNTRWETTLTSTKMYANPFTDVTVTVEYTKAGSPSLRDYGFWDGGTTFKLRQAFPESGTWHYKTTATDASNSGLHNREGDVYVQPYTGTNPLYRHGFLQVSADRGFLAHADGTPFLWVGDTLWDATVWLTEAGFHEAIADRRAKHFTVLQTNFAHKDEVDTAKDEVDTAGDTPWEGDRWNVRFMQKLDRMFTDANDQGMYLFVNGLVDLFWDGNIANYDRLVEMIGARYAAHHVSFASSMDAPYNSLLSGNFGYMYGTSLRDAEDADSPAWKALSDATYMSYLYDFFVALDGGRPLQPRHTLIKNQATRYQDRMVLGVSTDGMTYAAFLPNGGTIDIDLEALAGTTVGVTWYNPLTGQYHDQGTIPGGAAVHSFTSPVGTSQSALVLMAQ